MPSLIFLQVPAEYTEDDVREHFQQFGAIEFINMVKDKSTGKPKGETSISHTLLFSHTHTYTHIHAHTHTHTSTSSSSITKGCPFRSAQAWRS